MNEEKFFEKKANDVDQKEIEIIEIPQKFADLKPNTGKNDDENTINDRQEEAKSDNESENKENNDLPLTGLAALIKKFRLLGKEEKKSNATKEKVTILSIEDMGAKGHSVHYLDHLTWKFYQLKCLNIQENPKIITEIEREIEILNDMQNQFTPCLFKLHDAYLDERNNVSFFILKIESPFCSLKEILEHRIQHKIQYTVEEMLQIFYSLIQFLDTAHNRHIYHRNIKLQHIYFSEANNAYLMGDWNEGKKMKEKGKILTKSKTIKGTPGQMAPEVELLVKGEETMQDAMKSDIFSLGKVFEKIFTQTQKEHSENKIEEIISKMKDSNIDTRINLVELKEEISELKKKVSPIASKNEQEIVTKIIEEKLQLNNNENNLANDFLMILGKEYYFLSFYLLAIKQLACFEGKKFFKNEDLDEMKKIEVRNLLCSCQIEIGDYLKAQKFAVKCLEQNEKMVGGDNIETAIARIKLGELYNLMEESEKAILLIESELERQKKVFGDDHQLISQCQNIMGIANRNIKKQETAINYFKKSVQIFISIFGEQHVDTAAAFNNIGVTQFNLEQQEKALSYCEKSLEITRGLYGPEHIDVATSLHGMGCLFWKLSQQENAILYFEQEMSILKKIQGICSKEYASLLTNIALVHLDDGKYSKSLQKLEECLEIQRKLWPDENIEVADTLQSIALVQVSLKDIEKAIAYQETALRIKLKIIGKTNDGVGNLQFSLGDIYESMKEQSKAVAYFEEALLCKTRVYGNQNLNVASILHKLGNIHSNQNEQNKSTNYQQRALNIRLAILGDMHLEVAFTYYCLGIACFNCNNSQDALRQLERALQIRTKILKPQDPDIKNVEEMIEKIKNKK